MDELDDYLKDFEKGSDEDYLNQYREKTSSKKTEPFPAIPFKKNRRGRGFERIDSFSIMKTPGSRQSNNKNKRRVVPKLLLHSVNEKYYVIEIDGITGEGFHDILRSDLGIENQGSHYSSYGGYADLAKGVIDRTSSEIEEIKLEPEKLELAGKENQRLNVKVTSKDLEGEINTNPATALIYTSLSGGDIKVDRSILLPESKLDDIFQFLHFHPPLESYRFVPMDQSEFNPKEADIDKGNYKEWRFTNYYEGFPLKVFRRFSPQQMPNMRMKSQKFLGFERGEDEIYIPFIPARAEMSLKEFKKRTKSDVTVEEEELERTNLLDQAGFLVKLIESAGMDFDIYSEVVGDNSNFVVSEVTEDTSQEKIVNPSISRKSFLELEGESYYEFPKTFSGQYMPRVVENPNFMIDGSINPGNGSKMYR